MYQHRQTGALKRLVLTWRQLRDASTAFTGPCGHQVNGDPSSWSCPTCGASGSSSS